MKLDSKVAIVTGGAGGIGKATALRMAAEGAKVAVCDANKQEAERTAAEIGENAVAFGLSVADRPALLQMVETVRTRWGRVDILVNNAGITKDAKLEKMTEEQFDQVIDVNLKGVFNCTQTVVPAMVEQGAGVVLNASSIVGISGNFGQTNYAASKAGVIGMTRTWARELARHKIRVNAVAPGFIQTPMTAAMPDKVLQMMHDKTPLGRLGMAEDVASLYVFLASDDASFITGQVIGVDGGLVL